LLLLILWNRGEGMRLDIAAGERLVMKGMDDKCWAG